MEVTIAKDADLVLLNKNLVGENESLRKKLKEAESKILKLRRDIKNLKAMYNKREDLVISNHACERFAERVFSTSQITARELLKEKITPLYKEHGDGEYSFGKLKSVRVIIAGGTLVTVINKGPKYELSLRKKFSLVKKYIDYQTDMMISKYKGETIQNPMSFEKYLINIYKPSFGKC